MEPLPKGGLGGALAKPRRPVIACSVCQIRFNSQSQAAAHYQGNRHARRLKGLEAARARRGGDPGDPPEPPQKPGPAPPSSGEAPEPAGEQPPAPAAPGAPGPPSPPVPPPPGAEEEEEEKAKAKRLLYCALCKVAVNSLSQLEAHNKGTKHRAVLEARSGLGPIRSLPRPPHAQPPRRLFHCRLCNVRLGSELQLKQHISSRRHRDGVAGKPNPLLSRHKKPRSPPELAPLPFPKELPKALAGGGLLPPPLALAAAAAAMAAPPLALRPPGPPLLPGPPLAPALLRPAPGPLRPTHTPLLFSPY
ncbi:zinc finger protein 385A-like [Colius striatus]|uniref:zinc finger protein 385A-like n=1 Tax=Colius striatus TaxID=57412 RepID=UPI002B1E1DDD|nr:zinc finger protein 385A-like [Colius striatus]